jgi:AmmeMemoRadiSam system protein B
MVTTAGSKETQKEVMTMRVRSASFAGSWYPDIPEACEREIKQFISAKALEIPEGPWVGGIVPHAGWYFSGAIACQVIQALKADTPPDLFLLFGMHLHPSSPNYIMTEGAWETPFGEIAIETELARNLTEKFPFRIETARSHAKDNTIELQLPFIKYFFPEARIVPMGMPPRDTSLEIGKAAAEMSSAMGMRAVVIGSTDLTHYGLNYGYIPEGTGASAVNWVRDKNDRQVIDAILAMKPAVVIEEALANQNACCSGAAAAAIAAGKVLGATSAIQTAYATSYDKSPGDSFVGYVGVLF